MKMPEMVIVTVCWNGQEVDFEIPSMIPVGKWLPMFVSTAKLKFQGIQFQNREVQLYKEGKRLVPECTLEQCGIYDGSILELRIV